MKIPVTHPTEWGCRPPPTQHCTPLRVTDLTGTEATSALASDSLHYIHRAVGIKSISSTAEARRFNPKRGASKSLANHLCHPLHSPLHAVWNSEQLTHCSSMSLRSRHDIKSSLQLIDALVRSAANQLSAFDTTGQTKNLWSVTVTHSIV